SIQFFYPFRAQIFKKMSSFNCYRSFWNIEVLIKLFPNYAVTIRHSKIYRTFQTVPVEVSDPNRSLNKVAIFIQKQSYLYHILFSILPNMVVSCNIGGT